MPGTFLSAAIGAALTALALPRTSFWPLGWVGLIPLFLAWNGARSVRAACAAGFWAGFVYHGIVLHWIYATCRFAAMPVPVAVLAWTALAAALGLNWAAIGGLGRWLTAAAPRGLKPWAWAAVWTAAAAASARWLPRLNVDVMTYTQGPNLALLQAGSWGGPLMVGFVVVVVNAALAQAWEDSRSRQDASAATTLSAALALAAGVWAHGAWVLWRRPAVPGPTARVEILQPDIDQYHKWDGAYVREIFGVEEGLLAAPRSRPPALIVWPETSVPLATPSQEAPPEAARWSTALGATQLVGVIARSEEGGGLANAVQGIGPSGRVDGVYVKRERVPFGEYVPFRALIPRFVVAHWLSILDNFGDLARGADAPPLLTTPFGRTAVTICYEAMFPHWARRDAARGSRLLVNVTNDAWYKDTWGPYQHFAVNALRAIENRETVIRAGNTGISAVIDPWGEVVAELPLGARGRLDVDVPLADPFPARSFYSRHGDWLGAFCLAMTVLACVGRALARRA